MFRILCINWLHIFSLTPYSQIFFCCQNLKMERIFSLLNNQDLVERLNSRLVLSVNAKVVQEDVTKDIEHIKREIILMIQNAFVEFGKKTEAERAQRDIKHSFFPLIWNRYTKYVNNPQNLPLDNIGDLLAILFVSLPFTVKSIIDNATKWSKYTPESFDNACQNWVKATCGSPFNGPASEYAKTCLEEMIDFDDYFDTPDSEAEPGGRQTAGISRLWLTDTLPKITSLSINNDDCAICIESLWGKYATTLQCGHLFHMECIKLWLEKTATCPTCRFVLPTVKTKYFYNDACAVDALDYLVRYGTVSAEMRLDFLAIFFSR